MWVYPGPSGRLISRPDSVGNRILDYSGIGYMGGKVPLPSSNTVPVKIVVTPVAGDNVSNIQAAINYVSSLPLDTNGFRGAVFLSNGVYNVGTQIKISASGVVLRGAGSFTNGTGTLLYGTSTNYDPPALIEVAGSGSASTISGTTHNITNNYVPVGARSFFVDSASGLSVGQNVYVERVATSNWIADLGMNLLGPPPDVPWTPSGYNINMERTITHIEGNQIFVDAPITCAIDAVRYTNGTIRAFTWTGRITNSGVEHIFAQSYYGGNVTNENHEWTFVQFDRVVNGWARDLASQYFAYACVYLDSGDKFVTVQDCQSLDPISIITGGRRYAFNLNDSQDCLFKNCYTRQDRHQFVAESVTVGPSAFVDGLSDNAHAEAGPHQRWATGVLWDNITVHGGNNDIQNAGNYGTGHGWEGANCVIWNNTASGFIVQNPPFANNWLIGSIGPIQNGTAWNIGYTNMPHAPGNYDSSGSGAQNVFPDSLYFNQLQDRLAVPNLQPRDYWMGGFGQFTNNPIGGVAVVLDPAWSNAVKTISSGQPLDNFDIVASNHWVPFTFNFTLAPNERIIAATLALAMKASNSANGDVLYLDSTTNSLTFSSLNWLPIGTGTNITVRVLDLTNQLSLLTNGQFNVAAQGDIGIDWAMLELQVAPIAAVTTSSLTPVADASVRGGTSAGSNFGTATNLTVRQDASANNVQDAYLRWDLSGITGSVYQARVVLTPIGTGSNNVEQGVAVTTSDNWTETGITFNNQPGGGERFATWIPSANGAVSLDVTPEVLDALQNDKQLSVVLFSVATNSVDYASRENANVNARPQLLISQPGIGPSISSISDQTILPNSVAGPISFTIGGASVTALSLSGGSSNPNLVPNSNIVFVGSGTNRTVTITPLPNQTGVAMITVTVGDPSGLSASANFNLTVSSHSSTTIVWNGPGPGANNWSATNDWLPTFGPEYADNVKFFDPGASGVAISNVNSFVDANFGGNIGSLQYGNTNGNHATLIGDADALNISGASGLVVGTETDNGSAQTVFATITGNRGTLNLNNSSANLTVRQGSATNGSQRATLDISGLGSFNATVNQISVGVAGSVIRATGTLSLAQTNDITATGSPGILVGENSGNGGGQNFFYLGRSNGIYVDSIVIARRKANATLKFNPVLPDSSAYFRASDGVSRITSWTVGDGSTISGSTSSPVGTNDFTGGTVDILADTMTVGRSQNGSGANGIGTLTFNSGIIDVNTLQIGYQTQTGVSAGIGAVNVNSTNALLNVNTILELGYCGSGTATNQTHGTLSINGGTATINSIAVGAGSVSNSISLNNATLVLSNAAGSLALPIATFVTTNSSLQLSVTTGVTNCVTTTLICGGNSNLIDVISLPNGPGQYPLIAYAGAIGGAGYNILLGTLPTGAFGYLSNNIANSTVDLVITNYVVPDSFLTWDGDLSSDWDTETANWKNNVAGDLFYVDGSDVVFNDSASGATNVNLTDTFAPNSVTVSNNLKNFAFMGGGNLTGTMPLTKAGNGTLQLANSGSNDFTGGVTVSSGSVIVGNGASNGNLPVTGNITDNGALIFNRSNNVIVPNVISGSGGVSQIGGGVLQLTAANTFSGGVSILGGILQAGNGSALGAGGGVVISNGTLDVNALNLTAYPVMVAGAGAGSNGAIVNSGAQQTSALRTVILTGDTTFGGTGRWDIRNSGGTATLSNSPTGKAYKITKVGTNQVSLVGVSTIDPGLGDIDIQQGEFAIQTSTTQVGNPTNTITVHSNATLEVWALSAGPLNKYIVMQDGATFFSESGTSTNGGLIALLGNATFNIAGTALRVTNVVSGPGSLIKTGASPLFLSTSNTYAGSTLVNTGTLVLTNAGSIGASTNIVIASGATLDASGRSDSSLDLVAGQTLSGSGTVSGNMMNGIGATVSPGASATAVLNVTGGAGLQGTTLMTLNRTGRTNDVLQAGGGLTYGGVLVLTNVAGNFAPGDSFKLFNAAGYSGAFTNIVPTIPAVNLAWNTDGLATNGVLTVVAAPTPPPIFSGVVMSGSSLIVRGSNGVANWNYYVLNSTNITLPLAQWTILGTNAFDGNGNFSFTNTPGAPSAGFYLLKLQ